MIRLALALALALAACAGPTPEQRAEIVHAMTVACIVDGVVQPLANPIIGTIGPGGAVASSIDAMLAHPAVVAACERVSGVPVAVIAKVPAE